MSAAMLVVVNTLVLNCVKTQENVNIDKLSFYSAEYNLKVNGSHKQSCFPCLKLFSEWLFLPLLFRMYWCSRWVR